MDKVVFNSHWLRHIPNDMHEMFKDELYFVISEAIAEYDKTILDNMGNKILNELFKDANTTNADAMPVIKYIDKPNGGDIAYIRYDAMVKKFNTLLK